jgi:hypothetical protein
MYAPGISAIAPVNGGTLADFLLGYIGTIEGVAESLSEGTGRRFSEILVEMRQRDQS